MIGGKVGIAKMQNRVTSQDGVLEGERAVASVRKVASDGLSLRVMPAATANMFTCVNCVQARLPELANVSRVLRCCAARRRFDDERDAKRVNVFAR